MADDDKDSIVQELVAVLGSSDDRDLPVWLRELVEGDIARYSDLRAAVETEILRAIPVRWGGAEFDDLRSKIGDMLSLRFQVDVQDETDEYDVFEWADEFQPTIGLFPFYRIKEREQNWCLIRIGFQEKVCIALPRRAADALKKRIPLLSNLVGRDRPILSKMEFETFLQELINRGINPRFITFGSGHAAPKILAQCLSNNFKIVRFFVGKICYYRKIPMVRAGRYAAAVKALEPFNSEGMSIDELRNRLYGEFRKDEMQSIIKAPMLAGGLQGLADELDGRRKDQYDFVVSDLGATEFEYLKEQVLELDVWEIEHSQVIPVGIGVSGPGLVRIAQLKASDAIHEEVQLWFDELKRAGADKTLGARLGLRLQVDTPQAAEAKDRAEMARVLGELLGDLCRRMKLGPRHEDEVAQIEGVLGNVTSQLDLSELSRLIEYTRNGTEQYIKSDKQYKASVKQIVEALRA